MLGIAASVSSCAVTPGYGDGYAGPNQFVYGYSDQYMYGPVYAPAFGMVNIGGGWGGFHDWHGFAHWHGGGHRGGAHDGHVGGGHGGHGGGGHGGGR